MFALRLHTFKEVVEYVRLFGVNTGITSAATIGAGVLHVRRAGKAFVLATDVYYPCLHNGCSAKGMRIRRLLRRLDVGIGSVYCALRAV